MAKSVVLLERPARGVFNPEMRAQVEQILKDRVKDIPVPVTARWGKDAPVLRLDTKFVSWVVTFGPELFRVEAILSTLGRFLDTKKGREDAMGVITKIADQIGM